MSEDPKARAAFTYNAAADSFDAPPVSFWDRIGRRARACADRRLAATL